MSSDFTTFALPATACPRDGSSLVAAAGALGEDVCSSCQGRFLNATEARRLFVDLMGIPEHIFFELAAEGPKRLTCLGCGSRMTATWARGVQVDLCRGCGSVWLDGGELTRIARDVIEEVRIEERTTSKPSPARERLAVLCVSCNAPLDLTKTNWLMNTRPWCPTCARPYTGLLSYFTGASVLMFAARIVVLGVLSLLGGGARLFGEASSVGGVNPDVLRVPPEEAEKQFGSFFTWLR